MQYGHMVLPLLVSCCQVNPRGAVWSVYPVCPCGYVIRKKIRLLRVLGVLSSVTVSGHPR